MTLEQSYIPVVGKMRLRLAAQAYVVFIYLFVRGIWYEYFRPKEMAKAEKRGQGATPCPKLNSWLREKYVKYVFSYCRSCFEREVVSAPKDTIMLKCHERPCINMGSYNYLSYGGSQDAVSDESRPVSECAVRADTNTEFLQETEKRFAEFIGTESAVFLPMGWGTNVSVIPLFARDASTLIMSDRYNHASIAMGCKLTGAKVLSFNNNDPQDLELKLLEELQKHAQQKYRKILIIVEGIYSMEGAILNLPAFVKLKERYRAYLYVDEAHSIGALGASGRGICEHHHVDPSKIDVLMGTYTKSFASIGGYVAGSCALINYVKRNALCIVHDSTLAHGCVMQISRVLDDFLEDDGVEGRKRVAKLACNTKKMRTKLAERGIATMGDAESPVIPIVTCDIVSMTKASEKCLAEDIALVVAGYPATDPETARIRLCMSAAHSDDQIDRVVRVLGDVLL